MMHFSSLIFENIKHIINKNLIIKLRVTFSLSTQRNWHDEEINGRFLSPSDEIDETACLSLHVSFRSQ